MIPLSRVAQLDSRTAWLRLRNWLLEKGFRYSPEAPFTLASGGKSPYYFDCRPVFAHPEARALVGWLILDRIRTLQVDAVGGMATGAIPLALAVSDAGYREGRVIQTFYVRKQTKAHGTQKAVEGDLQPGQRVVVVEDVITTGGSTLEALRTVRALGVEILGVVAVIDRQEAGGRERILGEGIPFEALYQRGDFMPSLDQTPVSPESEAVLLPGEDPALAQRFAQVGEDLFQLGLLTSHAGNLSIREGKWIWITRSGAQLGHLGPEDLIPVFLETDQPPASVSMEFAVHQAIYRTQPEAGAVIHAHPVHAVALSLGQSFMEPRDLEGKVLLGRVPVVEAPLGSKTVAQEVAQALREHVAVLVRGHGSFVRGRTLEEALAYTSALEASSRILLLSQK